MNKAPPRPLQKLLRTFGISALRPGQREVIESAFAGEDTLAILPTGAGKSLCYQLPAIGMHGTTVVVSPLISLMKDQADKLAATGLEAAVLNSALGKQEQDEAIQDIRRRSAEFVFTTPERLASPDFVRVLRSNPIDLFVIDEAHCISHWGHDFRPAFLEIRGALAALGDPPVLALTATATAAVIDDIKTQLGRPNMRVINTGVYRSNLHLLVKQVTNPQEKQRALLDAVHARDGSGIVYCATVKTAAEVHAALRAAGVDALLYHGRLAAKARVQAQDEFMSGHGRVMVATNAFGMGIDKPDIRYIVHYQMPGTLEAYYQEAGRAGRDGAPASCTLLYDHNDRRVHFFFMGGRYPSHEQFAAVHRALQPAAASATRSNARTLLERELPVSKNKARVILGLLRDANLLEQEHVEPTRFEALALAYRERAHHDRAKLERMTFYAQSARCRWKTILEYFGEAADWDACGACDNCSKAVVEAALDEALAEPARDLEPEAPAPRALQPGESVRVPRYGRGRVETVAGDSVTVRFSNGETREFLRSYVRSNAIAQRRS